MIKWFFVIKANQCFHLIQFTLPYHYLRKSLISLNLGMANAISGLFLTLAKQNRNIVNRILKPSIYQSLPLPK